VNAIQPIEIGSSLSRAWLNSSNLQWMDE